MRIDLTQRFFNADDTVALDAQTQKPLTLKHFLIQACLAEFTGERNHQGPVPVPPDQKGPRYALYLEIKKGGDYADLSAEDVVLLKKAADIFPTLLRGQIHEMLEGKSQNTSKTPPKNRKQSEREPGEGKLS